VLSDPSYAAAAKRISAPAQMQAAAHPPLEAAVSEVEMAMLHGDYGRYKPYPHSPAAAAAAGGGGGADEL